uniref:FHA domain-containing protein n=1 Tax=Glossina brevipalpis TaxID=37001 RepID=A0A1A9X573_9MUSC
MNKSKKFTKSTVDGEGEISEDMSSGHSKEEEDLHKRAKKKRKQKDKSTKSRKKKKKEKSSKRKKHRHGYESGTESSSSAVSNTTKSSVASRSSESDITKKRKKMKLDSDEDQMVKVKSEISKEPSEKFCSKWESPPRKRQRSQERSRDESRDRSRNCRDNRERQDKSVRGEYRDEKGRSRENYGRRQRSRSPRRSRDRSYDRYYIKHETHSPTSRSKDQPHSHQTKPKREVENQKTYEWGKSSADRKPSSSKKEAIEDREKPNFGLSGALTEDTNKVNGVVIKYSEPPEARKPKRRWRLYPFKGETALPVLHIHRQSCFLVGRDRKIADLAVDHPSCSKQHAALQYRLVPFIREDGTTGKRVRLYLIDLESANGTFVNNKPIEARKYYELFEKDVIKFGFSTREYVLLHENSKEDQEDDDILVTDEPPSK